MNDNEKITYKIATTPEEYASIHSLNYATFVEEIPQHESNVEKKLIDKFNDENTYIIAMKNDELIGMIALRGIRPFSLDLKIPISTPTCRKTRKSVKSACFQSRRNIATAWYSMD